VIISCILYTNLQIEVSLEIVSGNAADLVYQGISEAIIGGDLPPGAVLTELEVAGQFDVSRTPVRAALARLTADGLLVSRGLRQLQVSYLSAEEIVAIYDLRFALEPEAAQLATTRGDAAKFRQLAEQLQRASVLISSEGSAPEAFYEIHERFDLAIREAIASPFLEKSLAQLQLHLRRIRRLSKDSPKRLARANDETAAIAQAIAAKDPLLAAAAMRVHLAASLASSLKLISENSASNNSQQKRTA